MKKTLVIVLAFSILAVSYSAAQAEWRPRRTIELIAPASPGGGWDMLCRVIQKTLIDEKLVDRNVIVVNRPGGGGSVGWTYLRGKRGQGEYLAATSTLIMLNNLLGSSELSFRDFTPLAALQTEWISVTVRADAPFRNIRELMDAIRANPAAVPIGVGPALGNNDHLLLLRLAKAHGVDPATIRFVVYPGAGGEIIPALLGGHIRASTIGLGEVLEQHRGGRLRVLGVSSPEPLPFLPGVLPFRAQGIDVVFPHWRGIIGPPGMTPAMVRYWDDVFSRMVQTRTWKEQIERIGWTGFYQNSADHASFLAAQTGIFDDLLTTVGLKR
ncbi:MAG TPA: tripartite tricarboxylate transporter substrate-binding protein [Magnetospirillaceae bacterium]|nr:tripartite tricarboxylate transporter substrate-binding protein [Magnetospirillaceae bacterium]